MHLAVVSSRTFFEKFFQSQTRNIEHAFNLNRDEEDKMNVLEEIPSKQNNRYTC